MTVVIQNNPVFTPKTEVHVNSAADRETWERYLYAALGGMLSMYWALGSSTWYSSLQSGLAQDVNLPLNDTEPQARTPLNRTAITPEDFEGLHPAEEWSDWLSKILSVGQMFLRLADFGKMFKVW